MLTTSDPDRLDPEGDRLAGQEVEVAAAGADRDHLEPAGAG